MGNWAERAAANMLHLSRAKTLAAAMREWSTTGGYEDSHSIDEVCELCEHEGLRYQYEIENSQTGHALWVGSTCITKFVPLYEGGREVIGEEAKANLLRRRQAEYAASSREERAFSLLRTLAAVDPTRFAQSSWEAKWKLGYSARQMLMLSVTCKEHSLPFSASDFRINTRKQSIVQQVKALQPWQYRRLRAALPESRRAEIDAFFRSQLRTGS
ncbi:MAG TPA: hypothetical protein VFP33_13095 [Gallionella sp.]|nr:hypothetical protein [Gallionella sp.]